MCGLLAFHSGPSSHSREMQAVGVYGDMLVYRRVYVVWLCAWPEYRCVAVRCDVWVQYITLSAPYSTYTNITIDRTEVQYKRGPK